MRVTKRFVKRRSEANSSATSATTLRFRIVVVFATTILKSTSEYTLSMSSNAKYRVLVCSSLASEVYTNGKDGTAAKVVAWEREHLGKGPHLTLAARGLMMLPSRLLSLLRSH